MNRRTFLKDAGLLVAALGLDTGLLGPFTEALGELAAGRAPLLWLQGQSCSGCSVSFLNSESPGPGDLVTRYLSLYFHQTLSAGTGASALKAVESAVAAGGYVLAVEGAVPLGMPDACSFGEKPFADLLARAARRAKAVVSVGTCASFGGIPAAPPNPTGAVPVSEALRRAGITAPLVNVPGCPSHPAWVVGNLVYLLKAGVPPLDVWRRPTRTYGRLLHEQCPLATDYAQERFARRLGDPGCLFKLGCQGVVTHADCSLRQWNGGVNWCVRAHAPCLGCTRPEFAQKPSYPFFRHSEGRVTA